MAGRFLIWICRSIRKLERVWEGMDISCLGFRRTDVMAVIPKYLDCGDLHMAFARARCDECGYEYLLGFSCKRRQFCPSCYQKRVIESGEWLLSNSDLVCVFFDFQIPSVRSWADAHTHTACIAGCANALPGRHFR